MALTTHVVGERERKALDWLSRHAKQCSDEQLVVLATNRPSWLGNADTARVAGAIDRELERRYVAGKGKVESLFDSPQAKQGDTQTTTTPAAPAPVVPATQPATTPAAVVVQQPPPRHQGLTARPTLPCTRPDELIVSHCIPPTCLFASQIIYK
jgi:hypothetical protein